MRDRERLVARIRQIRRTAEVSATALRKAPRNDDAPARTGDAPPRTDDASALRDLQTRLEHLEQLVEALQDSVHRESERFTGRIGELETQIQPGAISAALSKDARERGL